MKLSKISNEKGEHLMRKSALAILIAGVIVLLSLLGTGMYFMYQYFTGDSTEEPKENYIQTKGPDIRQLSGRSFKLDLSTFETEKGLTYKVSEGIFLKGPIGMATDSLYNLTSSQDDVINRLEKNKEYKGLSEKQLLEKYASTFRTILISMEVENNSDTLQPFGKIYMRDVEEQHTYGALKDVYSIDTAPIKEKNKNGNTISYDYYLSGENALADKSNSEIREMATTRTVLNSTSASNAAINELNLMDVSTPLLPGEKRSGIIAITSTRDKLNDKSAFLIYDDEKAKRPYGSLLKWGSDTSAAFVADTKVIYDAEKAKKTIRENSISDLYLSTEIEFTTKIKNPKNVSMKVNKALVYPSEVYKSSALYTKHKGYFAFDSTDNEVLLAIEISAEAKKSNAVIDGEFVVNGKKVPRVLFGRATGELLPDYQKDFALLTYRGVDIDKDIYISKEDADTYEEKTIQKDFLKGEKEVGFIYLSLPKEDVQKGKKIKINYK